MATGALVQALPAATGWYVDSVAFSHDGLLLANGGYDGSAEIRRISDGGLVFTTGAGQGTAHNVHFSPDDSQLIVATTNGKASVWDIDRRTLVLDTITVASEMADADFSPDGRLIAATGDGNVVRFWDATTGALLQTLDGHGNYISHVVWLDNDRVISGDWQGKVILWARQASGGVAAAQSWATGGQVLQIGLSPDRSTFVAGAGSQGFAFFSLD